MSTLFPSNTLPPPRDRAASRSRERRARLRHHDRLGGVGAGRRARGVVVQVARVAGAPDRKSVVWGKGVDLGGRRIIKKKGGGAGKDRARAAHVGVQGEADRSARRRW